VKLVVVVEGGPRAFVVGKVVDKPLWLLLRVMVVMGVMRRTTSVMLLCSLWRTTLIIASLIPKWTLVSIIELVISIIRNSIKRSLSVETKLFLLLLLLLLLLELLLLKIMLLRLLIGLNLVINRWRDGCRCIVSMLL